MWQVHRKETVAEQRLVRPPTAADVRALTNRAYEYAPSDVGQSVMRTLLKQNRSEVEAGMYESWKKLMRKTSLLAVVPEERFPDCFLLLN